MKQLLILIVGVFLLSFQAQAKLTGTGVAIHYLHGEDGNISGAETNGVKLAYQGYFDNLQQWIPKMELVFEGSFNYLHLNDADKYDDLYIFAASPILRYPIYQNPSFSILLEGGIGAAILSDNRYGDKNLGGYFTFEDRIGFAFRVGKSQKHTISTTYLHYSNGSMTDHNPGIDFLNLAYAYKF